MSDPRIVVVGSGVIGLTCAVRIQERLPGARVKILAETLATDPQTISYTSSWAGAHHVPVVDDALQKRFEEETFKEFWQMIHDDPSLPMMIVPKYYYFNEPPRKGLGGDLMQTYMPEFRRLETSELVEGACEGFTFMTFTIDTPEHLLWLARRFEAAGGTFERRTISHIRDALPADILVNATGLGSRTLGGVEDTAMYPTRGQTVLVRAPWIKHSVGQAGWSDSEVSYIIPRKGGTVILGGTTEADDWHAEPRPETSKRIMERALKLCPELGSRIEDLDVVREGCGLRPTRRGGFRCERDSKDVDGVPLIHAIGMGGAGFQASLGTANHVVKLCMASLGR